MFIIECLPLCLLSLFWPSTCSISLSLSLSLVLLFLSSFLSFFFLLSFGSLFFLFFSVFFAFLHEKQQHQKISIAKLFFINPVSFLVSCFVFSFRSLFLSLCVFSGIQLCFLFNINVFGFKKTQVEKHQFLVKRGVATKRFFFITCVLQNVKSYRFCFCPFLGQILVDVQKTL